MDKNSATALYMAFWKRGLDFRGTTTRREYWITYGINTGILVCLYILYAAFASAWIIGVVPKLLYMVYLYGQMVPATAMTVRRLQDTGRSKKHMLLALIPVAGPIILIVMLCAEGIYQE